MLDITTQYVVLYESKLVETKMTKEQYMTLSERDKRIYNIKQEIELALDEEDYDVAATWQIRLLHVLSGD